MVNAGVYFAQANVNKARDLVNKEHDRVEEVEAERKKLVADLKALQHEESSLVRHFLKSQHKRFAHCRNRKQSKTFF